MRLLKQILAILGSVVDFSPQGVKASGYLCRQWQFWRPWCNRAVRRARDAKGGTRHRCHPHSRRGPTGAPRPCNIVLRGPPKHQLPRVSNRPDTSGRGIRDRDYDLGCISRSHQYRRGNSSTDNNERRDHNAGCCRVVRHWNYAARFSSYVSNAQRPGL